MHVYTHQLKACSPEELRVSSERLTRRTFITARRNTGLSQIRFAAHVGCDPSTIENYERGATRVPAWIIEAAKTLVGRGKP